MKRRAFLQAGLLAAAPAPGNFIDAHVHVWTDDFKRYPLAPGFDVSRMRVPRFTPEDIISQSKPSGVNRIILIQMSYYRFDNSHMLDVIRAHPKVFRGIAIVDSASERPGQQMRRLEKQGVRGFRINSVDNPGMQEMFSTGAAANLAMCPLIDPSALPALGRQCEKHPDTPVIIDHLSRIGGSGTILDSDIDQLCRLARHPKVKVKLSAFYALGAKKPPHLDLVPLIRRVYDAFGPRRLMWASDCPFQTLAESYEDSISLIRDRLDFLSAGDKDWILRRTAEEFFFS